MFTVTLFMAMAYVYWENIDKFTAEKNFSFEHSMPKKSVPKSVRSHQKPIIDFKNKTMVSLGEFTTNMSPNDPSSRFVKTHIDVRTDSADTSEAIVEKSVLIRDAVIDTMSRNRQSEIGLPRGKERLKNEIRERVNAILGEGEVEEVYFTEFIMQ